MQDGRQNILDAPLSVNACLFDAYGTLFDVNAAAARKKDRLGDKAGPLAETWRAKQLQYTWLRSLTGKYEDFERVTSDALTFAMETVGIEDKGLHEDLMALYRELDAYPGVPEMLRTLRGAGMQTGILSNGSPGMLRSAVDNAGIADLFDAVISVHELRIFKPHPSVYALGETAMGKQAGAMAFMSSNAWDVYCAADFGYNAVWIDRFGQRDERIPGEPKARLSGLTGLPGLFGIG